MVTTRGDVHYVVTEYGVAYLHGKSVQERAIALISIAHPDFREQLSGGHRGQVPAPRLASVEGKIVVGPPEFRTTYVLNDGTQINFRPIHPTDEPGMRDLFYALSQETIYYRFIAIRCIVTYWTDYVLLGPGHDLASGRVSSFERNQAVV